MKIDLEEILVSSSLDFAFCRKKIQENIWSPSVITELGFLHLTTVNGSSTWSQISFCSFHINAAVQRTLSIIDDIWNVHRKQDATR